MDSIWAPLTQAGAHKKQQQQLFAALSTHPYQVPIKIIFNKSNSSGNSWAVTHLGSKVRCSWPASPSASAQSFPCSWVSKSQMFLLSKSYRLGKGLLQPPVKLILAMKKYDEKDWSTYHMYIVLRTGTMAQVRQGHAFHLDSSYMEKGKTYKLKWGTRNGTPMKQAQQEICCQRPLIRADVDEWLWLHGLHQWNLLIPLEGKFL